VRRARAQQGGEVGLAEGKGFFCQLERVGVQGQALLRLLPLAFRGFQVAAGQGSIKRQRAFHLVYFCLGLRQLGQCGRLGLAHQRLGRQRNGQLDPQGVCIRLSSRAAVAHHAQGQLG
jgi:hypothetical protein